jgi:hypothetical protein
MSVRHLPLCRRDLGIGPTAKLVLYVLADAADDDGIVALSVNDIIPRAELSRRAVFAALERLRAAGIVEHVGWKDSNVRRLHLVAP